MTAKLIDGKAIAAQVTADVQARVDHLRTSGQRLPRLAVILVGDHPASQIYVSHKEKACRSVGMDSYTIRLAESVSEGALLSEIDRLNLDEGTDGILVQLPLPDHVDRVKVISRIDHRKDVDGLTPMNQGLMLWRQEGLYPCTPQGILELIKSTGISLSGSAAAIVGRSLLVGMPVGQLLEVQGCTLIGLHSETIDCARWTKQADIVIVATGVHHLVKPHWIKPGAIVIDVGIHRVGDSIQGDVDFDAVKEVAGWISPVPGGVGPMTIAMLVRNCMKAYEMRQTNRWLL